MIADGSHCCFRLARGFVFPKPHAGVRPIACPSAGYRVVSSALVLGHSATIRHKFGYLNHAIGIPGGVELAYHRTQDHLSRGTPENPRAALVLDIKNAFNTGNRSSLLIETKRQLPALHAIACLMLGDSGTVFYERDNYTFHTVTVSKGVFQGDPLAGVLFTILLHPVLVALHTLHAVRVTAIMDDTTVLTVPEQIPIVMETLTNSLAPTGLSLNRAKCTIYSHQLLHPQDDWPLDFELISPELGFRLLGGPIGSPDYIREFLAHQLLVIKGCVNRFVSLDRLQDAFHLVHKSAIPMAVYLCRLVPPRYTQEYAAQFDRIILQAVARMLELPRDMILADYPIAVQQIQFPTANGGLGFRSAKRFYAAAYFASTNSSALTLELLNHDDLLGQHELLPSIEDCLYNSLEDFQADEHALPSGINPTALADAYSYIQDIGDSVNHLHAAGAFPVLADGHSPLLADDLPRVADITDNPKTQHRYTTAITSAAQTEFFSQLNNPYAKARILSASGKYASVTLTTLPSRPEFTMDSSEFRTLLATRLGLPLTEIIRHDGNKICKCNQVIDVYGNHFQACRFLAGHRTGRHHRMVDAYNAILAFATATGVEKEFPAFQHLDQALLPHGAANRIVDLFAHVPVCDRPLAFDVTIINPCSGNYRAQAQLRSGAANEAASQVKIDHYGQACQVGGYTFFPLAFEIFGAWSNGSVTFLEKLCRDLARVRGLPYALTYKYWKRYISFALANTTMKAIHQSLDGILNPDRHAHRMAQLDFIYAYHDN